MDASTLADPSAAEKDLLMSSQSHCRKSVQQFLGEGSVADVLLWKNQATSGILLVSSSIIWFLFEIAGYNPLLFFSNFLLILVVTLFFWGKLAYFLNWPPPSLPNLQISDDSILKISSDVHVLINRVLETGHAIIVGGNVKLLLKVIVSIWIVAFVGGLFNFITLVYIGVVLSLTVPALYNNYQDHIDDKLFAAHEVVSAQLRKFKLNMLTIQSEEKKLH
ncbi:hypothetical protein C5167_038079 [Papaver somniferum]|uniref:Reticulon-like protein n=1 Tax=Papaver somniferum TaxID=3469 RepID=A0A4Y7ICB4_PAPSO|nr:reticulon-like protein B11 isoform X1 [Papaver somniferum]RZC45138.1 hypothetical protein C5167_038079 [Papaver somniferum]